MDVDTLPYDDEAGDKLAHQQAIQEEATSLANRIGKGRLYLLADSSASIHARLLAKPSRRRRRNHNDDDEMAEPGLDDALFNAPPENARPNALLFRGDPISVLPTQRVLSYAASVSGMAPLGLEWIDDKNVVLVWETTQMARQAYIVMRSLPEGLDEGGEGSAIEIEQEDDEGFVVAKSIPETLWPMDARLQKVLGKDAPSQQNSETGVSNSVEEGIEVVKRPIRMRWARLEDVKEKGARNKSKFYERHGSNAGKEGQNVFFASERTSGGKRKREDWEEDEEEKRRRLDEELDNLKAGNSGGEEPPRRSASPPPRGQDRRKRQRRSYSPRPYDGDYTYSNSRGSPDPYASFNKSKGRRRVDHAHTSASSPYPNTREWDLGKDPRGWDDDSGGRDEFGRERPGGRRRGRRGGSGRDTRNRAERREAPAKEDLDAELDAYASRAP